MTFNVSVKISGDSASARAAFKEVAAGATDAAGSVEQSQRRMAAGIDGVVGKLGGLQGMFSGLAATLGGALAAGKLIEMADAVTTLRNRLELATGSATAAGRAYQDLFDIAQRSRTSFTELGGVYATLARAGQANLTVVEAIGNAMAIGGGSAQSMQAALIQLGQGMASGVLRGEELNSVMEQTPRLAKALADGLGVPIGQLRALGEQGQLTTERVMEALTVAAPQLAKEMERSTTTIAQGVTVAGNALTNLIGEMDAATGASKAISGALVALGNGMTSLAAVIKENQAVFAVIGTALAGATVLAGLAALKVAIMALIPLMGALTIAMGPVGLAAMAIAAALGAATAAWLKYRESTKGLENEAARLAGPRSIYDSEEDRDPAKRAAKLREIQGRLALQSLEGVDTSAEDARFKRSADAMTRRVQIETDLMALTMKQQGITKEYQDTLKTLQAAYEAGLLPLDEYRRRVQDLIATTEQGKKAQSSAADARKAAQKELDQFDRATVDYMEKRERERIKQLEGQARADLEATRRYEEAEQAIDKRLQHSKDVVQAIERETQLMTMSNVERQVSIALWDAEAKGVQKGTYEYQQLEETLRKAIGRREQMRETSAAWADEAERIKRMNAEIGQSLSDALMNGGKSAAEYIKGLFRSMVLRPIVEAIVRPLVAGLGLGGSGSALAGQQGGVMGQLQSVFSAFNGFGQSLGTQAGLRAQQVGAWLAQNTGGAAARAGGWLSSNAAVIGRVAGMAGNAFAGYNAGMTLNRGISDGYSVSSGYNRFQQVGMAVTSAVMGPVAGAIVGAVTGLVNRAFGRRPREVTEAGITGTIGSGGFSGNAYEDWRQKGGWFRSDRSGRNLSSVDAEVEATLDAGVAALYASAEQYAQALGLPAEAARNYSRTFSIAWGKTDEENKAAVEAAMRQLGDDLAGVYAQYLQPLQRAGETLGHTLERLGALQSFSTAINGLGGVFSRVARLGFDARQSMVDLAGGLEAFSSKAMAFVQEYYNRDEIAGLKAGEIQAVLQGLGIDQDISSRDDFRRLVDAVDVTSAAGREQLNALLDIAPAAAQVFDYLAETGRTLSAAASQAPTTSPLGSAFDTTDTVAAVNSVRTGVDLVRDAIVELTDVVRGGSSGWTGPLIPEDYEVNPGGA